MTGRRQADLDLFAEEILSQLEAAEQGIRRRPYRLLKSVLGACGYRRRTQTGLAQIQKALERRGVEPEPRLTERGLRPDDVIRFAIVEKTDYERQLFFPSDACLRDFIFANFKYLRALKNYRFPTREFRLPSGKRVDILCVEKGTGRRVVIEVEKESAETVGQVLNYMSELDALRGPDEPEVRGIIISGKPYSVLEEEFRDKGDRVQWFTYRVGFDVKPYP